MACQANLRLVCVFYTWHPSTIKNFQQMKNLLSVTKQSSCQLQAPAWMKNRVKEEVSPWTGSMSWLQKLKAAMIFLLHWMKLVWKKQLGHVPDCISFNIRKMYSGWHGLLVPLDDFLLRYVFELHEQGMVVTIWILSRKASDLCQIFCSKSDSASCWLCTGGWQHRDWGTGWVLMNLIALLQRQHWHSVDKEKVSEKNCEKKYIFFTSHSKQTLEMRGVKTVTIHSSTQDNRWATLAVTMCADGTKFPPMLIFKGEQNCRIVAKEFPTFPTGCEYFCHENVWTDEGSLLEWVEKTQTAYCNCTRKCCPIVCVEFLLMSHDGIGCWFNTKAWCGNWAYPWWAYITLSAFWSWY